MMKPTVCPVCSRVFDNQRIGKAGAPRRYCTQQCRDHWHKFMKLGKPEQYPWVRVRELADEVAELRYLVESMQSAVRASYGKPTAWLYPAAPLDVKSSAV